jgi:prefoldin subunit 5
MYTLGDVYYWKTKAEDAEAELQALKNKYDRERQDLNLIIATYQEWFQKLQYLPIVQEGKRARRVPVFWEMDLWDVSGKDMD